MVAEVFALTGWEFRVKVAEVAAAATVTLLGAGMVATAGVLLESATLAPSAGTGQLRATIPVEFPPPLAVVGFNVSAVRVGRGTSFCNMMITVSLPTAKSSLPSPLKSAASKPTGDPLVGI